MNSILTPRLLTICSLVKHGSKVIDVGSDHAYVPIFLVKEGIAINAASTDVNEGPIQRSRENIKRQGLEDKISVIKADGLRGIALSSYDTVIIAGMGGMLIAEILSGAESLSGKRLILQPMTAIRELRSFLEKNGFCILNERLCKEGEKLYTVMEVQIGADLPYSDAELILGRKTREDTLYPLLLSRETEKIEKQIQGLRNAKIQKPDAIKKLKKLWMEMQKL